MSEWAAAAAVAAAVEAVTIVKRDGPGAPPRTHDFDLEIPGPRVIALEVTTAAAGALLAAQKAVENKPWWSAPSLGTSWHLRVSWASTTLVTRLRSEAERHLAVLEQAGSTGFGDGPPPDNLPSELFPHDSAAASAVQALQALGIVRCAPAPERDDQDQSLIAITGMAGRPGGATSSINWAVAAAAEANRLKLEKATADEKHLFVWVDASAYAAGMGVGVGGRPLKDAPRLPPTVDVAWLAFPSERGHLQGVRDLWVVREGGHWEELSRP